MYIDSLYNEIDTFYKMFVQNYKFLNPRYDQTFNTVSWKNYISSEKFDSYSQYYDWAVNEVQYSFMFSDESMVQIYFEGKRVRKKYQVTKGSMAYLPRPDKYSEYFRFDVDFEKSKDYNHTAYHIHFGYKSKDVRFSLFHFPTPSEFIKFVLYIDYGIYCKHFNKKNFFADLDSINNKYNHTV